MRQTVLITGLGKLGTEVLRQMSLTPNIRIVGCDIDENRGQRVCNYHQQLAYSKGYDPEIEFERLDLFDVERIETVLSEWEPDVVFQSGTALSPLTLEARLPADLFEQAYKQPGSGHFAPMHVQFPLNVARAMENLGIFEQTRFINASYPDFVNAVLAGMGYPPDCGVGNIGTFVPTFEHAAAKRLGEPRTDVSIFTAMPHKVATDCFWRNKSTDGMPYYLKVVCRGEDVTDSADPDESLRNEGWPEIPDLIDDMSDSRPMVAASATRIIVGMLHDTNEIVHAPGPNGKIGGWPFRINIEGATVVVPEDTSERELHEINEKGLELDGIDRVTDEGEIVYTEENHELVSDALGYDCKVFQPDKLQEHIEEINQQLSQYME